MDGGAVAALVRSGQVVPSEALTALSSLFLKDCPLPSFIAVTALQRHDVEYTKLSNVQLSHLHTMMELVKLLPSDRQLCTAEKLSRWLESSEFYTSIALNLLKMDVYPQEDEDSWKVLKQAQKYVCEAIAEVYLHTDQQFRNRIAGLCMHGQETPKGRWSDGKVISASAVFPEDANIMLNPLGIGTLTCSLFEQSQVFSHTPEGIWDSTFAWSLELLLSDSRPLRYMAVNQLLPLCLSRASTVSAHRASVLWAIWNRVYFMYENGGQHRRNSFAVMSSLYGKMITKDEITNSFDLRHSDAFWMFIQGGLLDFETLTRKRALYLLKRVVGTSVEASEPIKSRYFQWQPERTEELSAMWDTVCMIYETVFETQVHVIEPVLDMMTSLYANADALGLDFSWISLLYKVQFNHENKRVRKIALLTVLNTNLAIHPALVKGQTNELTGFIFGPLFSALNETTSYYSSEPDNVKKDVATAMEKFFSALVAVLDDKEEFSRMFLAALVDADFDSVPLAYAACAMAAWPCMDAWGAKDLNKLQHLLQVTMRTHARQIRGIAQEQLLTTFTHLADTKSITVQDIVSTIAAFTSDGAMSANKPMWVHASDWMAEVSVGTNPSLPFIDALSTKIKSFLTAQETQGDDKDEGEIGMIGQEASSLALSVALLAFRQDGNMAAVDLLNDLIDHTACLYTQPPMTESKQLRCSLLLLCAMRTFEQVAAVRKEYRGLAESLLGKLKPHANDVISYFRKILFTQEKYTKLDDCIQVETYSAILGHMLPLMDVTTKSDWITKSCDVLTMSASCQDRRLQQQLANVAACTSLWYIAEREGVSDASSLQRILAVVQKGMLYKPSDVIVAMGYWGHAIDTFQWAKWSAVDVIIAKLTSMGSLNLESARETLSLCADALSSVSANTYLPLFRCMGRLATLLVDTQAEQQDEQDLELIGQAVVAGWESLSETLNDGIFVATLEAYVSMVYQPALLNVPELNIEGGILQQQAKKIMRVGEEKPGVVFAMVERVCKAWLNATARSMQCSTLWLNNILEWIIYGMKRKSQKHENRIIERFYKDFNQKPSLQSRHDYQVRTVLNSFLLQLHPDIPHQAEFALALLDRLLEQSHKQDMAGIAVGHTDTQEHRVKMRMWQTILVLTAFIRGKEEETRRILPKILEALKPEHLWSSTRVIIEWMVIIMTGSTPSIGDILLEEMDSAKGKAGTDCSFVQILFKVSGVLPEGPAKVAYLDAMLPRVFGHAMSNHYTVRAFAQHALVALSKTWAGTQLYDRYFGGMHGNALLTFLNTNKDSVKHRNKLSKDYFIGAFDPLKDYTVQFIFNDMLELCVVMADEQHGANEFKEISGLTRFPYIGMDAETHVDWREENLTDLRTNWKAYEKEKNKVEPVETLKETMVSTETKNEDVQKKIMPWEQMMQDDSEYTELSRLTIDSKQKRLTDRSLIVVASLVDKIPNLAGLCRTCEIFQASRLVFDNMAVCDTLEFKAISRTAEKWLPLEQVKQDDLVQYLIGKKAEGYSLIGVEQTAGSVALTDFKYPLKSVLVLGREREGLPIELIQLLDMCVEIPQLGTIRSLNVHVSGALLVWEYSKQCLLPAGVVDNTC